MVHGLGWSVWLFNIYQGEVIREVYERTQGTGSAMTDLVDRMWILSQLLLADDSALMAVEARQF